jgi:hypothetical protein
MYCPSCSTLAVEGAKFCKSCGMNLTIISQAINGGVVFADPARDRDFKRARKQISQGINGAAIGTALLIAAVIAYLTLKDTGYFAYPITLILALIGLIKLFKNVGEIVDAKVGAKLIESQPQPRSTAGLNSSGVGSALSGTRNSGEYRSPFVNPTRVAATGTLSQSKPQTGSTAEKPPSSTGRVNREFSTPLRKADIDEDLMARLRN